MYDKLRVPGTSTEKLQYLPYQLPTTPTTVISMDQTIYEHAFFGPQTSITVDQSTRELRESSVRYDFCNTIMY